MIVGTIPSPLCGGGLGWGAKIFTADTWGAKVRRGEAMGAATLAR